MMPHTIAEQCEDYVDAYGDQVIELLAQEMDPKQVKMLRVLPSMLFVLLLFIFNCKYSLCTE